jgi:hypothetical protein
MSDLTDRPMTAAEILQTRSALIELAARMARGADLPSYFSDDHQPRRRRWYWLRKLETASEQGRRWAMELREIADSLEAKP